MMQDHLALLAALTLVNRLQTDAAGVKITLLPWQNPASLNMDRLQSIDLVLSCATSHIAGLQREKLFLDTEVTVVRKGHPAASRMKNLKVFLEAMHVAVVGMGLIEDPVDG